MLHNKSATVVLVVSFSEKLRCMFAFLCNIQELFILLTKYTCYIRNTFVSLGLCRGPKASDRWYLNREPAVTGLQVTPPSSLGQSCLDIGNIFVSLGLFRGPKASDQWYLNREPAVRDLQVTPPSSPQQKAELKPLFGLLLDTLQLSLQAAKQDNTR